MRNEISSLVFASLVFLTPRSALAQDDPRRAQADVLMKEGIALEDKHREADALAKFQKAYEVYPTANILFAMATSEQTLGKSLDAIRHFRRALKMPTLHPNNAKKGKGYVAELEAKLGRVRVTLPSGATLLVDNVAYDGALDEAIDLDPGPHALEAAMGEKRATKSVTAEAGKEDSVEIAFAPRPPPVVSSNPSTPPAEAGVSTSERSTVGKITPIALGGIGVVLAGVGLGFLVASNSKASDATTYNLDIPGGACTALASCQQYSSKIKDAHTSRTISTIAFVGSGLFIAAAAVTFAFWPEDKTEGVPQKPVARRRVRFLPLFGPALGLQGTF